MSYPPQPPPDPGGGPAQPRTSQKAVWGLVLGVLGLLCGPLSIVGLILGRQARTEIDQSGGIVGGRGIAQAAVIVSTVVLVIWVVGTVLRLTVWS
ncbi:uncharacterized protein DUF4190 [Mumia flava]|uniref:Uncharacterized protein DUF4190 n=1 Tax=Mumia flava TaxID=1348852 RepID=A0A0B2BQC3_9ACTN|nr:DUF4190 domain-containing protein [Mumia flava]PJJ55989.1 uncharacterized protein DUF4190 [Mumia flava]